MDERYVILGTKCTGLKVEGVSLNFDMCAPFFKADEIQGIWNLLFEIAVVLFYVIIRESRSKKTLLGSSYVIYDIDSLRMILTFVSVHL